MYIPPTCIPLFPIYIHINMYFPRHGIILCDIKGLILNSIQPSLLYLGLDKYSFGFFFPLKSMGEEMKNFQEIGSKKSDCGSMESCFSSINDSVDSSSSLSSELADDASSTPSSSDSSTSPRLGPLFELADLISQLPIKRGLSKYYHGKSQTFGSLASVKSLEDLAKKESSYIERMKSCKSYGGNLNHHKFGPKATIAKKCPRTSFSPSLGTKSGASMVINCKN